MVRAPPPGREERELPAPTMEAIVLPPPKGEQIVLPPLQDPEMQDQVSVAGTDISAAGDERKVQGGDYHFSVPGDPAANVDQQRWTLDEDLRLLQLAWPRYTGTIDWDRVHREFNDSSGQRPQRSQKQVVAKYDRLRGKGETVQSLEQKIHNSQGGQHPTTDHRAPWTLSEDQK